MDLFTRFLSLRRRKRTNKESQSKASSGSSFEYGQPQVDRLSSDFDPNQYRIQQSDYPNFARVGIPIRSTTPRSLPLLDHPIDHVPRRDPNTAAPSPAVTIHRRKLLHRTEFPNADPPRSPRKQSRAHMTPPARRVYAHSSRARSFHRVESTYSDSSDQHLPSNSPRLEVLRQDPSVLSLVSVMDDRGFIPPSVFTNSPATPRPTPQGRRRHPHPFSKSTPELAVRSRSSVQANPSPQKYFNFNTRINAAPETPSARPKSEFLLPSFPVHIFPSQNHHATPESHSFSSLQAEQGSFSIPGDSSKKPIFSTHKSLTKASDAFRFLQHRYNNPLPPTIGVHNMRGPSVNDAVAESSSTSASATSSRTPHTPIVHEPERQQTLSVHATYNANLEPETGHMSFSLNPPGSHISHSSIISPLGSPLPVLTRIQPYSSSFSRTARRGSNHSSSDETTAPSPSRSLSDCSQEMSPRTPLTLGSPLVYTQTRAPAIVQLPSQSSAFEYAQDKKNFDSGHPTRQDTGFADREMIRTNRALHTTSGAHDTTQIYNCHVPAHSAYMESTREDPIQSRIGGKQSIHVPAREVGMGLDIPFNFNSSKDVFSSDSTNDDQQLDITPGRPTVVLVPSGRSQSDRSRFPASASASASVNLELEREGYDGPRFALGHDPRLQTESESLSSTSCASSFHTAHEGPVEPETSSRARYGAGHARNGTSGTLSTSRRASGTPRLPADFSTRLHLDSSSSAPLAASAGPALQVSSSPRARDQLHHGISARTPTQRIGLGVGMDIHNRAWLSTSSLLSLSDTSRDDYTRFATTRQTKTVPWSQFVSSSPSPGSGSGRR